MIPWASLRSEKDRQNIDIYREFVEKFSLSSDCREAVVIPVNVLVSRLARFTHCIWPARRAARTSLRFWQSSIVTVCYHCDCKRTLFLKIVIVFSELWICFLLFVLSPLPWRPQWTRKTSRAEHRFLTLPARGISRSSPSLLKSGRPGLFISTMGYDLSIVTLPLSWFGFFLFHKLSNFTPPPPRNRAV